MNHMPVRCRGPIKETSHLTHECSSSQKVVARIFQRYTIYLFSLSLFPCFVFIVFFLLLHLDIESESKYYINDFKIWTLKWLEPLIYSLLQNELFWGSNNVSDMNDFDFTHQIMHFKLLANPMRDKVFLLNF